MKRKHYFVIILVIFICLALDCRLPFTKTAAVYAGSTSAILDLLENKIDKSKQILLVTNNSLSSVKVTVTLFDKKENNWTKNGESFPGVIGKNGFAGPNEKREGDGRSPSGLFSLQRTFGYQASIKTMMPYRQALADDLWIDDVNAPDYNTWVKKKHTGALSYEKMKRDDNLYKYGIVIEYNTSPVIKGNGSAIFFHIWRGDDKATAGCVAVAEENIIKILEWLNPRANPVIIMGTEAQIEGSIK